MKLIKNTGVFFTIQMLILLFVNLQTSSYLFAQVKSEEVTVIAAYEPSLSDVVKINVNPEIPEAVVEKQSLNFSVNPRLFQTSYEPTKITPARLSGEPLSKLYQSYIKAGFGNYTTPFAELHYNNLRSRTSNLGLYYKHFSSSGEIKDYAPANFSDNILNFYGSRHLNSHILGGDFLYKRNRINYYGFTPSNFMIDEDLMNDLIFQTYNVANLSAYFKSDYSDEYRLNHSFSASYYNFRDYANIQENGLTVNANINKNLDLMSFIDNENIGLDANLFFYNNRYLMNTTNTAVVALKPHLLFNSNQYSLNVGINASIESGEDSYIHFFPVVEGKISIAEDVLSLYGELGGGIEKANLHSIYQENPFVNTMLPLEFTKNKLYLKGGLKGNVSSVFSFNIGASFLEAENMPFFVNDTTNILQNRFTLSYHNATVLNAFSQFSFQASDKLMMMLKGSYYFYQLDNAEYAWHKPSLEGSFYAKYNLVDKIIINAELFAQSKTYSKYYTENNLFEPVEIKAFIDGNIGLEYIYTKKMSAFVNFHNLTGTRYYRWYNYPTHRFHFLAGLTYAF